MAKLIEKTYGEALFSVAEEKNMVDELKEEADGIRAVLSENEEFKKFLAHPNVVKEEKLAVMENIFKGRISDEMMGFLITVIEKDRQTKLEDIFKYFDSLVMEYRHIGRCKVKSALPLTDEQKQKIEKKLLDTTDYESFDMTYEVDDTLLGGVIIRLGDCVVDGSIKGRLDRLARELEKVKLA
ncbi:MAG: F0F1 ATP synthase subunit delta [Lachnospiraceae bacterium]|nr:F0F1 ATP synthase subunit delta [Lachnospiraceae bacterium]